jgi:colicin import membrane protein
MSLHILPGHARYANLRPLAAAIVVMLASGAVQAQNQSMEERLRAQLRITTTQLQQAQNELAAFKGGAAAPSTPADIEKVKKDLSNSQAAERKAREQLSGVKQQNQAALDKANAQIAQYRSAYDELLKLARASEAERQRLAMDSSSQTKAVSQCEAKNAQLYAVGQEILHAYETVDMGTVMAARQPFAAQSRVKLDQIAQQYGDKLYDGRFDVRSSNVPAEQARSQ